MYWKKRRWPHRDSLSQETTLKIICVFVPYIILVHYEVINHNYPTWVLFKWHIFSYWPHKNKNWIFKGTLGFRLGLQVLTYLARSGQFHCLYWHMDLVYISKLECGAYLIKKTMAMNMLVQWMSTSSGSIGQKCVLIL